MHTAKFAKTLVQVGAGGASAFARAAGHALEFVPLNDPSDLHPGDTLRVQVLFRGTLLAHAVVHAGRAPVAGDDAPGADESLTGDANGVVAFPVFRAGMWNLRTGFAAPMASGGRQEWEVDWTTFVFRIDGEPARAGATSAGARANRASDSAAVAQVVAAFHGAIERGDSVSALALLAPDVTIMESGDVERLRDYRSHHLAADIEFARAVRATTSALGATVAGDAAWVASTSTTAGSFRGRAVSSSGAELMVLSRNAAGVWRIRAIHWSSHRR